jgi:cysteinyl-tRNA synthetase
MRLYNTLTRAIEPLETIEAGHVRMYTCGPTVYDFAHVGNFRTYVWEDLLRRTLRALGYRVTQVMNLTDVEDKIIARMAETGRTLEEVTAPYIQAFFEDIEALRIERAEHYPRATEHVPDMIALARRLEERGHAYVRQGSLYFRIASFPSYGRLSGLDRRQLRVGSRVDADEYDKADARDFVLWKAHRSGEPRWESPWGPGRPGWHLECSAMSMKYLGESFDLHTGGVDNIFPHHENEIAQSEGASGRPFVRHWAHAAHLVVEGEKMAKSKGNFYTLRDLLAQGHEPRAIRFLLLSTHYRTPLNFTFRALAQARSEIERLDDWLDRLDREPAPPGRDEPFDRLVVEAVERFFDCLRDDLNVSGAIGSLFRLVRETHGALDRGGVPVESRRHLREAIARMDRVLAVMDRPEAVVDAEIARLVAEREQARLARDFATADRIRRELASRGILVEDTPQGPRIKRSGVSSRPS